MSLFTLNLTIDFELLEKFLVHIQKYPLSLPETLCVFLPLFIGFINWRHLDSLSKTIWIACLIIFLIDLPLWYMALNKTNNLVIVGLQDVIVKLIFVNSFRFFRRYQHQILLNASTIILLLLSFYFMLFEEDFQLTYTLGGNNILLMIVGFVLLVDIIRDISIAQLNFHPPFWIILGCFLYSFFSVQNFMLAELLEEDFNDNSYYFFFSNLFDLGKVLFMVFIAIGFGVSRYSKDKLSFDRVANLQF